jgi:DNA-binding MarR family transcriptional regulator
MARSVRNIERQAADLDRSWVEIGRFFLSRRLRSRLHQGVAAELSPVQRLALATLGECPFRVGDLADQLGLAESSATRLVDRLERQGLVARRMLPTDRRSVTVELTPAGRLTAENAAHGRRAYLAEILRALEPRERAELVRLFGKVAAAPARDAADAGAAARKIS